MRLLPSARPSPPRLLNVPRQDESKYDADDLGRTVYLLLQLEGNEETLLKGFLQRRRRVVSDPDLSRAGYLHLSRAADSQSEQSRRG